ncbi:nitroreductase family deazaflavin-dependent oxidoreductase [Streptomyces sp. NPDC005805]|uniref:nitroreductase family deazaflavin-dependent oxidoreductase n=1 Tax=Streptomyces sp. NPDC005805 TaxID=3157068 RepID=UPI0033E68E66
MTAWDMDRVVDSPNPAVAEHVQRYLRTGGASGYHEGGMTNLLLTTVGRKTGALRRTGLFFGYDGDRYVLIASDMQGGPAHPSWYLNLDAHPEVHVQVKADTFLATARTAVGEERERLWKLMTAHVPAYNHYQANSTRFGRQIPVVVLERIP